MQRKPHITPSLIESAWASRINLSSLLLACLILLVESAAGGHQVSRPAGIIRITVPPRSYVAAAQPFDPWDASLDVVLLNQLTGSTNAAIADRVFKWDAAASAYESAWQNAQGQWLTADSKPSSLSLLPGEGFFLQARANSETQHVYLAGELLIDAEHSMLLPPAVNLLGYPYATATELKETALAGQPVVTPSGQPVQAVIPGEPFWVIPPNEVLWTEPCPYDTSLFPVDESPPRITDIRATESGIALAIATSGNPRERLDIFSQDLSTNRFDPNHGWFLAAEDLASDNKLLHWIDAAPLPAQAPAGRCYLVARSDVDQNKNSLPSLRERLMSQGDSPVPSTSPDTSPEPSSTNTLTSSASTNRLLRPIQIVAGKIVYVDQKIGNNALSGRSPVVVIPHGPKKTISAGLSTASSGDTVIIQEGSYGEDLTIAGKDVSVRIQGRVVLAGNSSAETNLFIAPPQPPFDAATNQLDNAHKPKTR